MSEPHISSSKMLDRGPQQVFMPLVEQDLQRSDPDRGDLVGVVIDAERFQQSHDALQAICRVTQEVEVRHVGHRGDANRPRNELAGGQDSAVLGTCEGPATSERS